MNTSTHRPAAAAFLSRSKNPLRMLSRRLARRTALKAVNFTAMATAVMLLVPVGSAHAMSTFYFSFTDTSNASPHVIGTVTGRILGLPDDGTDVEATSVIIDSIAPGDFFFNTHPGLDTLPITMPAATVTSFYPTVGFNAFTTVGGTLTAGSYSALWPDLAIIAVNVTGLSRLNNFRSQPSGEKLLEGAATFATTPVPEPAASALFMAGLGLMAFLGRRIKS